MRTGLFVGSFDPFTIGHDSVVRRSLALFDRLVIGVGVNVFKQNAYNSEKRVQAIRELYADEPKIEVVSYDDLTVDLVKRVGADYIVKGVRNTYDYEYEREQADLNRQLGGVETILLIAEPQMESISSTAIRQLIHFGKSIDDFLPHKK